MRRRSGHDRREDRVSFFVHGKDDSSAHLGRQLAIYFLRAEKGLAHNQSAQSGYGPFPKTQDPFFRRNSVCAVYSVPVLLFRLERLHTGFDNANGLAQKTPRVCCEAVSKLVPRDAGSTHSNGMVV
jgi:hypothetical protein